MNKQAWASISSAILLALHLFSLPLVADFPLPPEIASEAKARKYVKEVLLVRYPWLLSAHTTSRDKFPLADTIWDEQVLIKKLRNNASFEKLAENYPEFLQIDARVVSSEVQPTLSLDEKGKAQLIEALGRTLQNSDNFPKYQDVAPLQNKVSELIARIRKRPAPALLTAVINSFPKDERKRFFEKSDSPAGQLEMLRKVELSRDSLLATFDPARFSMNKEEVTYNGVLREIETSLAAEEALVDTLAAIWFINKFALPKGINIEELFAAPEGLDGTLWNIFMGDEEEQKEFLFALVSKETDERSTKKYLMGLLQNLIRKRAKATHELEDREVDVVEEQFTLLSVPPSLGIFRGYVGKDCSTTCSFAFPYSPMERTFFILDKSERILGYIGATILEVGKKRKRTLYVHDISGTRVSERFVHASLAALDQAAEEIGVEQISLPTAENIANNSDHIAINDVLYQIIKDSEKIEQHYLDEEIREILYQESLWTLAEHDAAQQIEQQGRQPAVNGQRRKSRREIIEQFYQQYDQQQAHVYDMPEKNQVAHLPRLSEVKVKVELSRKPADKVQIRSEFTPQDIVLDALRLRSFDGWQWPLQGFPEGVDAKKFQALVRALENHDGLETKTHRRESKEAFQELGFVVNRKFLQEFEELFWRGHFNAPDALLPQNKKAFKLTLSYLKNALRSNDQQLQKFAMQIVAQHFMMLFHQQEFRRFLHEKLANSPRQRDQNTFKALAQYESVYLQQTPGAKPWHENPKNNAEAEDLDDDLEHDPLPIDVDEQQENDAVDDEEFDETFDDEEYEEEWSEADEEEETEREKGEEKQEEKAKEKNKEKNQKEENDEKKQAQKPLQPGEFQALDNAQDGPAVDVGIQNVQQGDNFDDEEFEEFEDDDLKLQGADNHQQKGDGNKNPPLPANEIPLENVDIRAMVADLDSKKNQRNLERILEEGTEEQQTLAILELQNAPGKIPKQILKLVAYCLDNEFHDTDELSREAVELLLQFRSLNRHVNAQLEESVRYEENILIAFKAAVALLLNKQNSPHAVMKIYENKDDARVPEDLRLQGSRSIRRKNIRDCRQIVAKWNQEQDEDD